MLTKAATWGKVTRWSLDQKAVAEKIKSTCKGEALTQGADFLLASIGSLHFTTLIVCP